MTAIAGTGAEACARMDDGAQILVRRFGGPAAERVVISHGNGLAIDAFAPFAGALIARGFEVIGFDMRNHGRNPRHPVTGRNWPRFIKDFPAILAAIDAAFGPRTTHGAFHSLSSAVCLFAQADAPYPWASLTLFEPPVPAAADSPHFVPFQDYHIELGSRAARRRERFDSPGELAASMRRSSLFRLVADEDLARLAAATLRPAGDGGWELSCPRAFEAATFRIEGIDGRRESLSRVTCPVRIVVGDKRIHYAGILVETGRELARDFGFDLVELTDATHFMQIERPETCASLVARGMAPLAWPAGRPPRGRLHDGESDMHRTIRNDGETEMATTEDAAPTLLGWLRHWARHTPERLAVETLAHGRLTYRELHAKAEALAASLLDLGLRPGDHVAIQLPSLPEFLVTYFACCRAGLVLTTMHAPYRFEELKPLMAFAGARAVVTARIGEYDGPGTMHRLRQVIPSLGHVIVVGQDDPQDAHSFDALVARGDAARLPPEPGADATCTLCFTSGTSAAPKGVRRTQRLMAENAERFSSMVEMVPGDRVMIAPPLTHVFGLLCAGNGIRAGATVLPLPIFSPPAYADYLVKLAPTVIYSAPAHLAATLKSGVLDTHPASSVRDVIVGGSICPPAVAREFESRLPNGRVGCLFGMTEALLATQTDIHDTPATRHGTVGRIARDLEARIAGQDGAAMPQGEMGELQLSGYSVLAEYEGNPEATAASFTGDGWFRTGDLAYLDTAGNIVITGRVKDIINRGGIKINPADIESLLDGHDRIVQSALVPMPDEVLGERICLYATLTPGPALTLGEVCEYLAGKGVAKMRWPERLEIIAEMPMTPTKKITKSVLVTDIRTKLGG